MNDICAKEVNHSLNTPLACNAQNHNELPTRKMQMDINNYLHTKHQNRTQRIDFTNNWVMNERRRVRERERVCERERKKWNQSLWIYLLISRSTEFQFNRLLCLHSTLFVYSLLLSFLLLLNMCIYFSYSILLHIIAIHSTPLARSYCLVASALIQQQHVIATHNYKNVQPISNNMGTE